MVIVFCQCFANSFCANSLNGFSQGSWDVMIRINSALQRRLYHTWIDLERMRIVDGALPPLPTHQHEHGKCSLSARLPR